MGKCEVCGSENNIVNSRKLGMFLCRYHYERGIRNKDPFAITIHSPNEVIIHDSHAEIVLRNIKCEETGKAKVSLDKLEEVKKHKWHISSNGYVVTFVGRKAILLHKFVIQAEQGKEVDHINGDKLDNRNDNLRVVTPSQNQWNKGKPHNNKSGVTGVYYSKVNKGWVAQITYKKKYIYLGTHENKEDAIKARKEAEMKYRGKYIRKEA